MLQEMREYPFRTVLSLKPLVDFWQNQVAASCPHMAKVYQQLAQELKQAPALLGPLEDISLLEPHRHLLTALFSVVFPPASWETAVCGALVPFSIVPVHVSPSFQSLFLNSDGSLRFRPLDGKKAFVKKMLQGAYFNILRRIYGFDLELEYQTTHLVEDPDTGLDRYFQVNPDLRFVEVATVGPPKELSDAERRHLKEHLDDPRVLAEVLPPENFEFRGFTVARGVDVTDGQVLSALEKDLIDQQTLVSVEGFERLQHNVRTFFGRPDLVLGLAALQDDKVLLLNSGCRLEHNCLFADSMHLPQEEFKGSVFSQAVEENRIVRIADLAQEPRLTRVEDEILAAGFRSKMVAPLHYQGQVIGTMDLASPQPDSLGPLEESRLQQVQPLFSLAVKKSLDELDHDVQGLIKEKCTALHPSVEWAFRKAAFEHLDRLRNGQASEWDSIVFKDVFPLYAQSDIRGSSTERNRAVQADLGEHLRLAQQVVRWAGEARPWPLLGELDYQIQQHLERIGRGVQSGDETSVVSFLQRQVEPVFKHLGDLGPRVIRAIEAYQSALDSQQGTVYQQRRLFQESVSLLNERLSTYLDQEQLQAQEIFPHYFEKRQTDGIDYTIYLGASMVENRQFSDFFVRNLRLWQLMVTCGIAWHSDQVKLQMSVPLQTAHLILVQHAPLRIRFRFDEKRFDVDGAYDVRHAIVRARVDKAVSKADGQRLTQPGKIAVVYSTPAEGQEMVRYIRFLQDRGFLKDDLERLELDELPGVEGLRALRVGIDLAAGAVSGRIEKLAG